MNLFDASRPFRLHSGIISHFKIECDALTESDWDSLAFVIAHRVQFGEVIGIPRGGLKLAHSLQQYKTEGSATILIVDDVLTTGKSFTELRDNLPQDKKMIGVVVFARGKCPDWVTPIFQMDIELANIK